MYPFGMLISIGDLGEDQSQHKIEKIKMDTLFISNTKNGVRVKTHEVTTQHNPQFLV